MADKVPVQDKLSKILAELIWCIGGTEEDDEYAGQMYLQLIGEGGGGGDGEDDIMYEGNDGEIENNVEGGQMYLQVIEDDDGDTMEIIEMEDSDDGMNNEENSTTDEEEDAMQDEENDEGVGESDEEERINYMEEKHCRGAHLVSIYISTFLQTVRREWGNVDKHRVDKFYTAVRFMISEVYKYMAVRHWSIGIITIFNDVIYEEGLSDDTPGLTNGLRYHLIDICIDELAKVNRDAEMPLTEATFLDCVEPFFVLAKGAVDKNVQRRVMDNVLLKFLNEYSVVSPAAIEEGNDEDVDTEEGESLIFDQVHVGTVSKFIFELGSDNETDERFRKSLYEMHKTFERQIRAAGRDVDLDQYFEDEEDEVKADDEEEEEENEDAKMAETREDDENITSDVTKYTPEKKKKRKSKQSNGGNEGAVEVASSPKTPTVAHQEEGNSGATTPKSSSKKKKRKQQNEATEDEPTDTITLKTPTPKSKKKKKQKSPPSVDPRSMNSPDGDASYSDNDDAAAGASKRVSFGKMNHCKSYKASSEFRIAMELFISLFCSSCNLTHALYALLFLFQTCSVDLTNFVMFMES